MIPVLALAIALGLSAQGPLDVRAVHPADGPMVLVHRGTGPLIALRLSARVDTALPDGSVELLQELARPMAAERATSVGARLSLRHEEGHAIVTVTGPATAFDALAGLLSALAGELDLSVSSLRQARSRAESRVLGRLEQPEPRVRTRLWHALYGGPEPEAPTATLLGPESVRELRDRLYHRDGIRITLVGDIPEPLIRSAFASWPVQRRPDGTPPVPDSVPTAARPQAHREWAGVGFTARAASPAVLAVAAHLVQERMDRSPLLSGSALGWHGPGGPTLVLLGAVVPGDSVVRATAAVSARVVGGGGEDGGSTGVGRYLRRMVAEAASLAGPAAVAEAKRQIRRRLLLSARTVTGRVEVVGALTDVERDPGGAARFLEDLDHVDARAVMALLENVLTAPAVYVEAGE